MLLPFTMFVVLCVTRCILILGRSTGSSEEKSKLSKVTQLTGFSDPVYAEAIVSVNQYDIVLDVLIVNQTGWLLTFIDLVLINQQSVGKRSLHLMDTIKAKKGWTIIYWRVHKFLKESYVVTRLAKERVSFLKINDIIDILFFGTPDCHHCCFIAQVGMLILCSLYFRFNSTMHLFSKYFHLCILVKFARR
jgi:hypothetical protein